MKRLAIGIDIGGTRTKIGLVDLSKGKVLGNVIFSTEKDSSVIFENGITSAVSKLSKSAPGEVEGIGIGVSGFVWEDGTVDSTYGFISFMEDYPLAKIITSKTGLPCRVDNDARTIALGEARFGNGKGYDRVLMLSLGTGLGLGFIQKGKLSDPLAYAHMGGHITIATSGDRCYCGKVGCLESLVAASALVKAAVREGLNDVSSTSAQLIFEAADNGDTVAQRIINQWLQYLKIGIHNYVNIFAPDHIILGGGIAKSLTKYLDFFKDTTILRPYKNYSFSISISQLEEQAGILGSAGLFNE